MSITADKSQSILKFGRGKSGGGHLPLALLLLTVVLISLAFSVYTYLQWRDFRNSVESSVNVRMSDSKTYLGSNIKSFDERISSLEKIMEPFSLLKPDETLSQVIDKANSEIEARNEERFRKVQEKIDAMTEEVVKAREKAESADKKELLFISLVRLRQKIDSAQGFNDELQMLQMAAGNDQVIQDNINALKPRAGGIPSVIELRDDFSRIAGKLVRQEREEKAKEMPFYERFAENLSKGISIRKVKNVEGESAEALVAHAEDDLRKGDVTSALQELAKLDLPGNADLNAWLEKAKSYSQADIAFNNMLGHIIDDDARKILSQNQEKSAEESN